MAKEPNSKVLELESHLSKALESSMQGEEAYDSGLELKLPEICLSKDALNGLNLILKKEGFELVKQGEGIARFYRVKYLFKGYQPKEIPTKVGIESTLSARLPEISQRRWKQYISSYGRIVLFGAISPIPPIWPVEEASIKYRHHGNMESYVEGRIFGVTRSEKGGYLCGQEYDSSIISVPLNNVIWYLPERIR